MEAAGLGLLSGLSAPAGSGHTLIATNSAAVGLRALAANRQIAAVAQAAIAADFLQALDITRNFAAQISFDGILLLDLFAEAVSFFLFKVFDFGFRIDLHLGKDLLRLAQPDTVDIGEGYVDSLFVGDAHACDSNSHNDKSGGLPAVPYS